MKTIQKAFIGVASSISVAAVAVLGRPYLQQVLMSQQYQRRLSILTAKYRATLRDIDRRADELGAAFFESKRDYFEQQVRDLGQTESAVDGAMFNMLQTTKKVAAMELRVYAMRQHILNLRRIGAKQEATELQEAFRDQIADNDEVYAFRMRQADFPVNDLIKYLRENIPKTV